MRKYTMNPRGLGANTGRCLVCGSEGFGTDFSSFVSSKETGESIMRLFETVGCHGYLDFRSSEPNWVQFKIVSCKEHKPNVEMLYKLICDNDGVLDAEILVKALTLGNDETN